MTQEELKTATAKDLLIDAIEYCTDEQVKLLTDIATLGRFPSKHKILEISGFDTSKTYDTAYPIDYYRRIAEIYPDIEKATLIFDYSDSPVYGNLVNISNLFLARIINVFSK